MTFVRDRTKIYQRMEKFLESSGIKLSSVVSSLTGVSARHMLEALIDGKRDAAVLAELAQRSMRRKIPDLIEALEGRFTQHHAFMMKLFLHQVDELSAVIDQLTVKIEEAVAPFQDACAALETVPGISRNSARVILGEIGTDMRVFSDAAHLASWAGVCPGQNESAGRSKSSHTRGGDAYLKAALGTAALSAIKQKDTFLAVRYRRLYPRRGGSRALVAIEHNIIVAIWHLLANGEVFKELGPNYYAQRNGSRSPSKAVRELERLGYEVQLSPLAA